MKVDQVSNHLGTHKNNIYPWLKIDLTFLWLGFQLKLYSQSYKCPSNEWDDQDEKLYIIFLVTH